MNFFNVFEDRISSIFGSRRGFTAPFSFKRLAKRAAHEMENETFVIDGVDTAPALFTVLVSGTDDSLMRPFYDQLTLEIRQFVEAQAQVRGYSFVGEPLVRFMVDPSLRSGKFSVFAENVDARTLERLRAEERAYYSGNSNLGGAAKPAPARGSRHKGSADAAMPGLKPIPSPAVLAAGPDGADDAGLDVIPASELNEPLVVPSQGRAAAPDVPATKRRGGPANDPYGTGAIKALHDAEAALVAQQTAQQEAPQTCLLIDRQSGRTYTAIAPKVIIGRERTSHGIVLRDPNVSRRHAELAYTGTAWRITDLNSTNGTLVNDVDVDQCFLRDGDLITLGLVNLEFREN